MAKTEKTADVEAPAKEKIVITGSYKTKTQDGDRIFHKFTGSGSTIAEALEDVKGSDEDLVDEVGRPFPPRVNLLVNITVRKGDYVFERACASHVANDIFTGKNAPLVARLFGV